MMTMDNAAVFPITGLQIILNITVAVICGLAISLVYRNTYRGPGYSISFANSIVLLTMITALVIMTIGSNVARAFGLVGAMSIIRFRTAVKDTQDIVYIFFALSIGLASGCGAYTVAAAGTLCIGTVIFIFARMGAAGAKEEYLLEVSYSGNGDGHPTYIPVFRRFCRSHHVINTRSSGVDDERLEIAYYVRLRDKQESDRFVRELRRSDGVNQVNLYFDEEQF